MSNEQIYTLAQIKSIAAKHNYRLGECIDNLGAKVCPSHGTNVKVSKWIDGTLKAFTERPQVDPGVYFVQLYQDTNKKLKPDTYPIGIGNYKALSENGKGVVYQPQVIVREKMIKPEDNPLSWSNALEYQRQISQLETKCKMYELEIQDLKRQIQDLENEEPETPGLGEGKMDNFFSSLLPVADQFFKQQQQKNRLEFLKLTKSDPNYWKFQSEFMQGSRPGMQQRKQVQQPAAPDPALTKCNEWTEYLEEEEFQKVQQIRDQVKNFQEFQVKLNETYPDLYLDMYNFVNGIEEEEEEEENEH